jgi:TolB-like protein/DNA-binding winged helix-turn-helix (wHTH) protein/Tfp pilus assembly protein PilF
VTTRESAADAYRRGHYRFGDFVLDLETGFLRRNGQDVALRPKSFEVLTYLVVHHGRLVPKNELVEAVWADTAVTDNSLSQCLFEIRRALDDDSQTAIRTVARRGYVFDIPVSMVFGGRATMEHRELEGPRVTRRFPRSRPRLALGAVLIVIAVVVGLNVSRLRNRPGEASATPPGTMKLAVLPFENLTGDPGQEYFSDGLTEEMIAQLGHLNPQRLGVIARTSAMRYKKSDRTIEQIGRELGVDYILTGSARTDAGRVRVTASLVQSRDQTQLWSESYDRELSGILALQEDVAKSVARALALQLLPIQQSPSIRKRPVNPEAYDAYLKGMAQFNIAGRQSYDAAMRYFELALQKDPNEALAYSGVARVWHSRVTLNLVPPIEGNERARGAALKAVELDDTRAEAHAVLGLARTRELNWAGAEAAYKRAIAIDPNSADAHAAYSQLLTVVGRPEEAKEQIDVALKLDPFNALVKHRYALGLFFERRLDDAIQQWHALLEESPGYYPARYFLWQALHLDGRDEDALVEVTALNAAAGEHDVEQALTRGAAEGGYSGAMRASAAVLEARGDSGDLTVSYYFLAATYVHLGDKDRALKWLERGFDVGEPTVRMLLGVPTFDILRDEPRFKRLMQRMNLPHRSSHSSVAPAPATAALPR